MRPIMMARYAYVEFMQIAHSSHGGSCDKRTAFELEERASPRKRRREGRSVPSPAGQAAWILEKFWAWTDCHENPENALTRDEMLDDIMLYWLPNAAASSARLYWESFNKRKYEPVRIPVGCSIFPKEFFRVSRRWAEKRYPNLVYWNRLDRGGHFAAFEQPDLFVKELRACFRKMRAM